MVTYEIKITDLTNSEVQQPLTANTKGMQDIALTHSHTYKIEVCAEYDSELSAYVEGTVNMVGFFTVTYDAGNKGNFNGQSTVTVQVDEGTPFTADKIPTINNQYVNILEFDNYTIDDTDNQITANYTLTKDITLKSNYTVIAPTNLTLTKKSTSITVQIEHPSDQNIFTIKVTDITPKENNLSSPQTITGAGKTTTVSGLLNSHKYNVEVCVALVDCSSTSIEESITIVPYVPILLLMYMDGDNNLNDPIFLDLNEAEYGLYLAGDAAKDVKVFTLWDGGPRSGGSGNSAYTNQFADSASKLLELGKEQTPVYTNDGRLYVAGTELSSNTIDRSGEAEWLSSGEVDMSNKNTLKNFLKWATDHYDAGKIFLQFSNHGGGPRSYMPKELILPNGEKIELNDMYGRRSMCWDNTTGGSEYFLKTSDLSDVFDELGFGTSKQKIELIMEDVCLGGSIEEAYEIKDYANYFLASPNTIPGMGFDYTNLVKTLCENADASNVSEILGTAVIEQYAADYAWSDAAWLEYIDAGYSDSFPEEFPDSFQNLQEFAQCYYNYLIGEEVGMTSEQASEYIYSMALDLSLQANVSTLSLIDLSQLVNVKTAIDGLAQELLDNASTNCSNIWADQQGNLVTNPQYAYYYVKRLRLIIGEALRPYDNIKYQGTYSWLYDIGTMLNTMAGIANTDGWTELLTQVTNVRQALTASVKACWRDGLFFGPTYSTIVDTNILCSNTNVPYGLTISGETFKVVIQSGNSYLTNGDYPSWYTDLKFGQDCKWNDLLDEVFPFD